ncbi:hypothetical protein ABPG77_002082 [Micractinium sp. CCAP 211/92]
MQSLFGGKSPQEALAEDAAHAVEAITKLTSSGSELKGMPKSELHACQGLAFTFMRKLGAGITLETGHGMVIRKIAAGTGPDGRATWKWSAPLVMKVASAGLGLSLGFSEMEAVTVLDTAEAVSAFAQSQWTIDTEMQGAIANEGVRLPATAINLTDTGLSDKTFAYSSSKGAIVDMSWSGTRYGVDAKANAALYGEGVLPQAILDGSLPTPECMQQLYAALDKIIEEFLASQPVAARET